MDLVLEMHTDSCTRTVYSLLVDVVPLGLGSRHLPPDPVGRPSPDGLTPVAEARAERVAGRPTRDGGITSVCF